MPPVIPYRWCLSLKYNTTGGVSHVFVATGVCRHESYQIHTLFRALEKVLAGLPMAAAVVGVAAAAAGSSLMLGASSFRVGVPGAPAAPGGI